jgi:hypothetical protein
MLATPPLPDAAAPNPSPGLPLADVVVHIAAESLETGTGVARVTARGGDVGPVLLDQLAHLLGHHRIRVLPVTDLDHTVAYRRSTPGSPAPPGQTRISNLGPLGRREYRAKTAGIWTLGQPEPGVYEWTNRAGRRWRVSRGRTIGPRPNRRIDVIFG